MAKQVKRSPRPHRSLLFDTVTAEIGPCFCWLDRPLMESEAWKCLSAKAHEIYPCLIAKWDSATSGGIHPKDVPFGVKDCERFGVKIMRAQLYKVMAEHVEAGLVKYNRTGGRGTKNTFRLIDDWRDYKGVFTVDTPGCIGAVQVGCTSQEHPVPSEINYEDVLCDLREKDLSDRIEDRDKIPFSPMVNPQTVDLKYQANVWKDVFKQSAPDTAKDVGTNILVLLGETGEIDTGPIEKRIELLGVQPCIDLCVKLAETIPIRESSDFLVPFFDEADQPTGSRKTERSGCRDGPLAHNESDESQPAPAPSISSGGNGTASTKLKLFERALTPQDLSTALRQMFADNEHPPDSVVSGWIESIGFANCRTMLIHVVQNGHPADKVYFMLKEMAKKA